MRLKRSVREAGAEEQDDAGRPARRRDLGRLPEDAVAGGERLDDRDAIEEQRIIPRADNADDAARPAVNRVALSPQPQRPLGRRHAPRPQQVVGLTLQEQAGVGQRQDVAADRFFGKLAEFAPTASQRASHSSATSRRALRTGRRRCRTFRRSQAGWAARMALDLIGDGGEGAEFHAGYLTEQRSVSVNQMVVYLIHDPVGGVRSVWPGASENSSPGHTDRTPPTGSW